MRLWGDEVKFSQTSLLLVPPASPASPHRETNNGCQLYGGERR